MLHVEKECYRCHSNQNSNILGKPGIQVPSGNDTVGRPIDGDLDASYCKQNAWEVGAGELLDSAKETHEHHKADTKGLGQQCKEEWPESQCTDLVLPTKPCKGVHFRQTVLRPVHACQCGEHRDGFGPCWSCALRPCSLRLPNLNNDPHASWSCCAWVHCGETSCSLFAFCCDVFII